MAGCGNLKLFSLGILDASHRVCRSNLCAGLDILQSHRTSIDLKRLPKMSLPPRLKELLEYSEKSDVLLSGAICGLRQLDKAPLGLR